MPSSLMIGALVVAWLAVLVPMIARKRQEVARTADSTLAARVVRSGGVRSRMEEDTMPDADEAEDTFEVCVGDGVDGGADDGEQNTLELPLPPDDQRQHVQSFEHGYDRDGYEDGPMDAGYADDLPQRYRPGRGGFDPEGAEIAKQARYAHRRRVVLLMMLAAVASALFAAVAWHAVWWLHGGIDVALVAYLSYLRRQVRIEEEIRQRRLARLRTARREHAERRFSEPQDSVAPRVPAPQAEPRMAAPQPLPGVQVVDLDDGDPEFDVLAAPDSLPYRRAVGE